MTFEVRSTVSRGALVNTIRRVLQSVNAELPLFDVRTQNEQIADTLSRQRMFATLTAGFGFLALVLACVGIYGVVANSVASRVSDRHPHRPRGPAGRSPDDDPGETGRLAALGVTIGVLAAGGLARYIRTLLYGLTPFSATTPPERWW